MADNYFEDEEPIYRCPTNKSIISQILMNEDSSIPDAKLSDIEGVSEINVSNPNLSIEQSQAIPQKSPISKVISSAQLSKLFDLSQDTKDLKLIQQFSCWWMSTVLLKGIMYLTNDYILFHGKVPKEKNEVIKSGFLNKRNTAAYYTTYWFVLTEHSLCYYEDSTDLYYPYHIIDLKNINIIRKSQVRKNGFTLITNDEQKFMLQADTQLLLNEWVTAIQRAIFKINNKSQVKIVVPIQYMVDIEINPAFNFADSVRIKSVENSFAVDEHYFIFFDQGDDAVALIKNTYEEYCNLHPEVSRQNLSSSAGSDEFNPESPQISQSFNHLQNNDATTISLPNSPQYPTSDHGSIGSNGSPKAFSFPPFKPSEDSHHRHTQSLPSNLIVPGSTEFCEPQESAEPKQEKTKKRLSWLKLPDVIEDTIKSVSPPKFPLSSSGILRPSSPNPESKDSTFYEDFVLPEGERLQSSFGCLLLKVIPRWGRCYVTQNYFCFQCKLTGVGIKTIVPLTDIIQIQPQPGIRVLSYALEISTKNSHQFFLEFRHSHRRDECLELLEKNLQSLNNEPSLGSESDENDKLSYSMGSLDLNKLTTAMYSEQDETDLYRPDLTELPIVSNKAMSHKHPSPGPMHITCLTIGTRGDVQPYIALCKGLKKHGHKCRIATHEEYREWVEGHDIEFKPVAGDPSDLMKLCVDHGMFSIAFIKEGLTTFKGWIEELLETAWEACQGTDLIIESPSAMAGIHIAEKLDIPYFGSFPFPWTRTKNFPHPFAVAGRRMGGSYNVMTYMVIEQVLWTGTSSQINKWRKNTLELPAISIDQLEPQKVPYLYSFSPSIVPPPSDWHDWIHPCGYWFLDQPDHNWEPPQDLVEFIKGGEKPPVYIGFGSIVVQDPDHLTQTIIDAVVESGCRVILSEGWSARGKEERKAFEFPSCIYPLKSVPHDWLFPQVSAVVHHGGAGTTAAGLRAGVPTIIHPYFGDQYFWAQQVQNSGCGIYLKKLTVEKLSKALVTATSDPKMIEKAGLIGKQIRSEDGVERAINFIYRDIDAARKRLDRYKQLSKQSKVIPSIIPGLLSPATAESQDKQGLPISILSDGEESGWCLVDSNAQVQN